MDCLEGIMYGGGFVQGGFVQKWLMSRGSYVWRGFCPEGVLSAHHEYRKSFPNSQSKVKAVLI